MKLEPRREFGEIRRTAQCTDLWDHMQAFVDAQRLAHATEHESSVSMISSL